MTSKPIYGCNPIQNSDDMFHYVYRITNIISKKHYYGKRSSKIHPFLDLGKRYRSSSSDKLFMADQKQNPQNYKYKIVAVFETAADAIEREVRLHNMFDVGISDAFINVARQKSTGFDTTGLILPDEVRKRQADGKRGRFWYTNIITQESKKFLPIDVPVGWKRGRPDCIKDQLKSSTKNKKWYHNPVTNEESLFYDVDIPLSWIIGRSWTPDEDLRKRLSVATKTFFQENPDARENLSKKSKEQAAKRKLTRN